MDFSKHLFRCSSLGHLMTEPKSTAAKNKGELSEGAKTHLIDIYVANKYNRHDDIITPAILKGTTVENDSMTIYSAYRREFYRKNEEHLLNEYIKGTPDIRDKNKKEIIDIKSNWDAFTFFRNLNEPIKKIYYWQLQGYMWLDNAVSSRLVYCLVNTPEFIIEAEAARLKYKIPPSQLEETIAIVRNNLTFNDIHYRERIIEQKIERNQADIDRIKATVIRGREYLLKTEKESKLRALNTELS